MTLLPLTLFATLSLVSAAPAPSYPSQITQDLDFSTAYLQFFRVKQLIDQINIRRFEEFGLTPVPDAEAKSLDNIIIPAAEVIAETSVPADKPAENDDIPEIDLTDEAIMSDTAGIVAVAEPPALTEVTTAQPAPVDTDSVTVRPREAVIDSEESIKMPCLNNFCISVSDEEVSTSTSATDVDVTTDTAPEVTTVTSPEKEDVEVDPKLVNSEVPVNPGPVVEDEDESLNEIDTGSDKFFVSKDTISAARKYGYKILFKKIGGKEVPVGKIKFSLPTIVEITPEDDKVVVEALEEISPKMEIIEEVIETTVAPTVIEQTTDAVEIDMRKESEDEIDDEEVTTVTVDNNASLDVTTAAPAEEEVTTLLSISDLLPEPLTAVIPSVDIGDTSISDSVIKISKETETALEEIKNKTSSDVIVFSECSAPIADVETMLAELARNVASQADNLAEILSLGQSIKDTEDAGSLAKTGAQILRLVDPFLESLVPPQITSCAGSSSSQMLISLSGMASQLDTIAASEADETRASDLHQTATSLQIAAWALSTLQQSVHGFYGASGICGQEKSSTAEILGSLSQAITGYVPIVTMLGNEESVADLKDTIAALNNAKENIKIIEQKTGSSLPGVKCGASFSEMAKSLDDLADFITVAGSNNL